MNKRQTIRNTLHFMLSFDFVILNREFHFVFLIINFLFLYYVKNENVFSTNMNFDFEILHG